jgi:glycine betaine catabolism B
MPITRRIKCITDQIISHGNGVYTLILIPDQDVPSFQSGQFLHLTVDEYHPGDFWPDSRAFSIASKPSDRKRLVICYSVKGKYTTKMESNLHPGSTVWVKLPFGDFVIDLTKDIVLIAGGTGITAFTSFLETIDTKTSRQVFLFYGAKEERMLIYHELLSRIESEFPNFHVHYSLENPTGVNTMNIDSVHTGRISVDWIWSHLPNPNNIAYYLSGPPNMLSALSVDLKDRNINPDNIRIDAWE